MDFLNNFKTMSLPVWVIILLAVIIFSMPVFGTWIIYKGISNATKPEITVAAISLIATTLPILIASIAVFFSNSGINSLQQKTDKILNTYIKDALSIVPDDLTGIRDTTYETATVYINHKNGRFYSDYKIQFVDNLLDGTSHQAIIIIRIELNVKRVNFSLYIDKQKIEEFTQQINKQATDEDFLKFLFPHCLASQGFGGNDNMINYQYNPALIHRTFENKDYYCVIAASQLSPSTLWDTSNILYFTQDLVLMVRGFYQERKSLFWVSN